MTEDPPPPLHLVPSARLDREAESAGARIGGAGTFANSRVQHFGALLLCRGAVGAALGGLLPASFAIVGAARRLGGPVCWVVREWGEASGKVH